MNVLALNAGSGSLRYKLFARPAGAEKLLKERAFDRVQGRETAEAAGRAVAECRPFGIDAIGCRVVHGAELHRYGFHGIAHRYVTGELCRLLGGGPEGLRVVSCHLGGGASACAVRDGRSVDTSMGLTPLEGLVMGTRCGDLDPGVVLRL